MYQMFQIRFLWQQKTSGRQTVPHRTQIIKDRVFCLFGINLCNSGFDVAETSPDGIITISLPNPDSKIMNYEL